MLLSRITERVNSYKKICIGYLPHYALRFHKISKDGSGKANAFFTGNDEDNVWGVIGEISMADKKELDKFEGLGKGYNEDKVMIETENGRIIATIYVADTQHIDTSILPYDWYKDLVLQGCVENQLPTGYIEFVRNLPNIKDVDNQRQQKHQKLLKKRGA